MEYVQQTDSTLYNLVEEYLQIKDDWSDFEEALASIDVDSLIDYASMFLKSYGADDWRDSAHHDYQFEIDRVVSELSTTLKQHFIAWLKQLKIPHKKSLKFKKKAQYLTFNYTNTLQNTYKISNQNILHIHGSLKQPKNIILGHGWKPKDNQYVEDPFEPSEVDVRILEGNTILEDYFLRTFKPTDKIIKKHRKFFKNLKDVRMIYVLGHSISNVDIAYFHAIVMHIKLRKTQWIVSYHNPNEKQKHKKQLQSIGIPRSNIKLIKLSKLKRKKNR
ncbi:hypothetical protein HCR_02210 [Hydrogenimonas cancrithermarum]|uniref:Bacteriophage abortive infection AbiH n=2 Tax=Hydrogenimonas cancrithermarum TaxID=2993563 RepID=A0ABN6WT05_9BACT|nr:hypothetical protein HCR_02210 [Hydrogenimonas cancrithermarum]